MSSMPYAFTLAAERGRARVNALLEVVHAFTLQLMLEACPELAKDLEAE